MTVPIWHIECSVAVFWVLRGLHSFVVGDCLVEAFVMVLGLAGVCVMGLDSGVGFVMRFAAEAAHAGALRVGAAGMLLVFVGAIVVDMGLEVERRKRATGDVGM